MTAPIHNGYWLILGGGGGNDTLVGTDSITALFGDNGNDALWTYSRTRVFYGGNDHDVFMGCSYENGAEQYVGGSGTDYVADRNNAWLTLDGVERNAGSCPI
jgi:Ca2+-binding RTX toxin-like protein